MSKQEQGKKFWFFILIRTFANTFLILGLILTSLALLPLIKTEVSYQWGSLLGQNYVISGDEAPKESGFYSVLAKLPPIPVIPVDTNFGIVIEKINVNAPVVPDVDSSHYETYMEALKKGAAHAAGTAFPGSRGAENNNVFIFAHSTLNPWEVAKYNAIFILLNKLEKGDRVVTFYKGKRFDYTVFDKKVVEANDVKYLTEPYKEPILTLQTCDPPGTQWRRMIVSAKLVGS